jgi:hypothetical protein
MLGLDVDNDSAFINETLLGYCKKRELELTRSRAYRKNDQAWIEQKNGAVIRKLVGYGPIGRCWSYRGSGWFAQGGALVREFLPNPRLS